jgi:hypothetical protein
LRQASAYENVCAVVAVEHLERVGQAGVCGVRWLADHRAAVGLFACDPAAGLDEADHLRDDLFGVGHVDEDEPCVNEVE